MMITIVRLLTLLLLYCYRQDKITYLNEPTNNSKHRHTSVFDLSLLHPLDIESLTKSKRIKFLVTLTIEKEVKRLVSLYSQRRKQQRQRIRTLTIKPSRFFGFNRNGTDLENSPDIWRDDDDERGALLGTKANADDNSANTIKSCMIYM